MDPEKQPLTFGDKAADDVRFWAASRPRPSSPPSLLHATVLPLLLLTASLLFWSHLREGIDLHWSSSSDLSASICPQVAGRAPPPNEALDANKDLIFSPAYRNKSASYHSGLVKVKSESFDDLGAVGEDPRWDVFFNVEKYLRQTFPLLHGTLHLQHVNTHGLVYTWNGSDASLKPVVLMAHQDTVPVPRDTLKYWTYPPWDGVYDGTYMWGRGASDCKNTLSGTLEAVTLLLEKGFKPRRTIILAYGFDEESSGREGAGHISEHLESIYGPDGVAFILDEGGLGIGHMYGTGFALPSTGEKGYVDVNFTLHTPGGHSSIPPAHTSIGILGSLAATLEATPYSPSLSLSSPIFSLLQCAATHGDLPKSLKGDVLEGARSGNKGDKARQKAADTFAAVGRAYRYLVSTSQAADITGGGVKVNALPELAFLVVNYRVSVDSSVCTIKERITGIATDLAKTHSLNLDAFGTKLSFASMDPDVPGGDLKITALNELEPAPVSPTTAPAWDLLASTIKHVYAEKFPDGLIVSPSVMTGNTDTRYMWNLTKNVYRFTPIDRTASVGIHTVDEHLLFDDHISGVWLFHELLRNADAATY